MKTLAATKEAANMTKTMATITSSSCLKERILSRYKKRGAKAAILWPLVLYGLIQMAPNLMPLNGNSPRFQDNNLIIASQQDGSATTNNVCGDANSKKFCSSSKEISAASILSAQPLLSSAYLQLLQIFNHHQEQQHQSSQDNGLAPRKGLFGPNPLIMAEAYSLYQPQQDRGIIFLNSTNLNHELIQYKQPFPHIKLIEYYVSFCGFCANFKTTYTKLAREIHPWRNVIRPSAIDLGVSSNSPIAHSWSVEVIPTLRIHPPPNPKLAAKLDKQLSHWTRTRPNDLQREMFHEYNSSNLMIRSLPNTAQYMDKVALLKSDLLRYIESYVRANPNELPVSWPNLRPVTETSLAELCSSHPRKELFLIIEGPRASDSDQSLLTGPSLGLSIMMELSSSAPYKAIRYVRASDNRALVDDVIAKQKNLSESANQVDEQVEMLNNLLSDRQIGSNNIVLVHIDDSRSFDRVGGSLSVFHFMTIVTSKDLVNVEQTVQSEANIVPQGRVKRALFSFGDSTAFSKMNDERKVELISLYINHTYTETNEDRIFVRAINNLENSGIDDIQTRRDETQQTDPQNLAQADPEADSLSTNSITDKIFSTLFNPPYKEKIMMQPSSSSSTDYNDKLAAIRYLLFQEVPRASTFDKSLVEQQEKLNTLVNLVTVIKTYFPLPDLSSVQFIDGVQGYLTKQQSKLSSVSSPEQAGFDTRAFKKELKRLETEGKRVPEIERYNHCKVGGYPCALWRLFHTLAAFEYKKLSQILHQAPPTVQPSLPSLTGSLHTNNNSLSSSVEAITMKQTNSIGGIAGPSPVERLVSPPSTTASLSLTIATPTSKKTLQDGTSYSNNKPLTEAELPMPVLLVMRDYVTNYFSCEECRRNFRTETEDLSLEKIRQQPAEFSMLWLWRTHNRVNKRLSVDPATNPQNHPKVWFPTYHQCATCYKKPPSYLQDTNADSVAIFQESIDWNESEVLSFLLCEYTKQPMDNHTNLFGYQVPYSLGYILIICLCFIVIIILSRCLKCYIERQKRHKATLLNGNGINYSIELQ